ncbi:MucBP domain-containing protein [Lentilactobacillus parafarraginis]|uniref:MucBP domain-containing protein n=1 Tax=Lentilactobacillus parafarraginis TaxID=390842 RepID=UPI0006D22806|nr:MucBP domain-containing protein [Lentilactobacillus parafarraginis]
MPAQKPQSTGQDLKQPVENGADQPVTSPNADREQGVAKSGHQKSKTNKNKKSHQHKHQAAKNTKDNKNTASQPKKFLVQAVDETGAEIYSKSMNTTAEKLQHENFELFGYDLEKTTLDNDQNRHVLHYRRKAVTLKVRAVDESGAALATTQLTGKFGNSLSYTAQVIPGYHVSAIQEALLNSIRCSRLTLLFDMPRITLNPLNPSQPLTARRRRFQTRPLQVRHWQITVPRMLSG